ncbi:MAG: ATP-binding protein [Sphingobacterium sp.]
MKLRTRLSLLFTLLTAAILLIFALVIYYTAKDSREKEFYSLLKKEAITKANLFLDANVNREVLQDIYANNRKLLDEVEVAIYDTTFNLLYHDAVEIDYVKETQEMFEEINENGEIGFYQENWQVVGLRYQFHADNFIVIAAAYDQYGYSNQQNLAKTIAFVFMLSILFIYIIGWFFSKKALEPVKVMMDKAKKITASNLDQRLIHGKYNDELSQLAHTFNEMLDRLEDSFEAQKQFVSTISHELRTPLSAIIAELDLSIGRERTSEEYKAALTRALQDSRKLVRLSNSLLDFAKASYDPSEIAFKSVRVDEVLVAAMQEVLKANPEYHVDIHFEREIEDDKQITVHGNEYLLKVAFLNLFENGSKFSADHKSRVCIGFSPHTIVLRFQDRGIGISPIDIPHIFEPFYRGENSRITEGNGIGLSLTKKIITLHSGQISVCSVQNETKGTTIEVSIPTE